MGRFLFILVFQLLSFSALLAQDADSLLSSIKGVVLDDKKQPIIGAIVQVTSKGKPIGGSNTDEDGKYSVNIDEPGKYELKISCTLYKILRITDVIVSPQSATKVNAALELDVRIDDFVICICPSILGDAEDRPKTVFTSDQIEHGAY